MIRKTWVVALLAPTLVTACMSGPEAMPPSAHLSAGALAHSQTPPRLTVAQLRAAKLEKQESRNADDDIHRHLTPSPGDVIGLSGSVLGDVVAGLPGGATLGFGGQVAGGNDLGKAMGSTLGALIGSILGPIGGIVGSVAGGAAGRQIDHAVADPRSEDDLGPVYIEGIDTGPLATAPANEPRDDANRT